MDENNIKESIKQTKQEVSTVFSEAAKAQGKEFDFRELSLAMLITEVAYDTELPKFGVTDITSVKNETVSRKAGLIMSISEVVAGGVIPASLVNQYPLAFDEETLKKAPWVNLIHAWMKVLNEFNSLSAMQRADTPVSANVIASIAHVLYGFTTNSDGDPFIRSDKSFLSGEKYAETVKRESGTEGANPQRHVNFEEMKYIVRTVHEAFMKGE